MAHLLIHRGLAKKNLAENTIEAFKYCFKKRYGIETDIHCTQDGKIVCFHDFTLKRKFKTNRALKKSKYKDLNDSRQTEPKNNLTRHYTWNTSCYNVGIST